MHDELLDACARASIEEHQARPWGLGAMGVMHMGLWAIAV